MANLVYGNTRTMGISKILGSKIAEQVKADFFEGDCVFSHLTCSEATVAVNGLIVDRVHVTPDEFGSAIEAAVEQLRQFFGQRVLIVLESDETQTPEIVLSTRELEFARFSGVDKYAFSEVASLVIRRIHEADRCKRHGSQSKPKPISERRTEKPIHVS